MKISKAKLRQIIKEELGTLREQDPAEENYVKLVNTLGDIFQHHLEEVGMQRAEILRAVEEATEIELVGNEELSEGQVDLEALVQREFQAWQEEQKANRNKFQPGLGAGGSAGKAATHRSEVFDKVKRKLIQDSGLPADDLDVGEPIYKEIYTILYDLIPRPRR